MNQNVNELQNVIVMIMKPLHLFSPSVCESDDGQICNNQIVTSSGSSGGGNILLIAVVVVIVIVVIVVIGEYRLSYL